MANDGQIIWEVQVNTKGAKKDIKSVTDTIEKETKNWDKAAKESTDNIGNNFSNMLKKLAAGFSIAKIGQALLNFGKDAVQAASDLQEVQNVVDVTFGDNAGQIEKWAKNAGTQFGLTETMAKRFSSTMGAMLKSSGLAGEQIVDVSTNLAGLAADMASFYNLDFEEAFSKIRSGISGMTMPLKELGIDMSVDTLNAFALAQGLGKTFNEMSQAEQTMLRYQYLMQATADAQGDFSRTSDGFANKLRILDSEFTTLKTTVGTELIGAVSEALGWVNDLVAALTPDESRRTVLDEFADIDLNTETKIAQIQKTAEEARLLTDELDKIGGSKADKAGSKVQQIASDLANINLENGKAKAVQEFISVLAQDIPTLAALQGTDAQGAQDWLNNIATAANNLNEDDAAAWSSLVETIKTGLPGIENTDFGVKFFEALGSGFSDVESKSSVLSWMVETLGDKTNKTAEEQRLWLETCKRLVQTIPGLSSIINTETGEVKGGTEAVKNYIKAWEDGQKKVALLGALDKKQSALDTKFSELPGLELDMIVAKRRAQKQWDELEKVYAKYGQQIMFDQNGIIRNFVDLTGEERKEINGVVDEWVKLGAEFEDAAKRYTAQKEAYDEAVEALKEYKETIEDTYGDVDNLAGATEDFWVKNAENIRTVTTETEKVLKELDDYVKSVHENVAASVDSTVKGFGRIQTSAERINKLEIKQGSILDAKSDEFKKIADEINSIKSEKLSSADIAANLKQQAEYMQEYIDLLNKARGLGISNEVLAEVSDGSVESFEYLQSLAEATPQEVKQINDSYQSVIDKKKELTDELTKQQLSVDKTYQTMAEKAKEAVDALNLAAQAKDNSGQTVQAIAEGIGEHVDDVKEQVDAIIAELNRLDGYGVNIDFGGFGSINFTTTTGKTEGSGRFGLDYVPHDDYIARLHQGERVLTAQENQIWNSLLNGGYNGFDLDALGGVMRDNVKAGGNVYLNGKEVGKVISDQQGKNYKSLQRSGWQS